MKRYRKEILEEIYVREISEDTNPQFMSDYAYEESLFRKVELQEPLDIKDSLMFVSHYDLKNTRNLQFFHSDKEYRLMSVQNPDNDFVDMFSFDFTRLGVKDYLIEYQYEKNSRKYLRNTAGNKHLDDQGRQLSAKNLIVQIVRTDLLDEEEYLKIDLESPGRALFFVDGRVQEGKWQREQGEIHYYNKAGEEIALRPGNTWIHIVPSQDMITY